MNKKSLKFNIFVMFFIPSIAFLYFSLLYIQNEYKVQNNTLEYKFSVEVISTLSDLLHNIQLERGFSAGYLVNNDKNIKERLEKQYQKTDAAYYKLMDITKNELFEKYMRHSNRKLIWLILKKLNLLDDIRIKVENSFIDFEQEMRYYTDINTYIIKSIKNINIFFINIHKDPGTIENIQKLKELAGIQRAYIYNTLLSNNKNEVYIEKIKKLSQQQDIIVDEIVENSNESSWKIYNKYYDIDIERMLNDCFFGVIEKKRNKTDAQRCFDISTKYIDVLGNISSKILKFYLEKSILIYEKSVKSLYMILFIWFISVFVIFVLMYIVYRLIKIDEEKEKDLRVAAYTFEAYEGMVITDPQGTILRVNNSFTNITGYSKDEIIGENPRILKSDKHHDKFFENMWRQLTQSGEWQGEIINKRKNGDIYHEMLSIKSIKDKKGVTTHYIGQFIDISEMKEIQRKLQFQADHDFLTDLLNRKALLQRLYEEHSKSIRHNLNHAFLFIDLDNFKQVNDEFGHNIGDEFLINVANLLKKITRNEDIVARISGDEFGILLVNLENELYDAKKSVGKICNKILNALSNIKTEYNFEVSASIGVRFFPKEKKGIENILLEADRAMYQAKKDGKNRFVFFCDLT